ncbi:hypothetical protein [Nostoc linckia]|uniref:hypothetical protein n=4 Tax=Nostoc linckia TaxID=92942 RepID=UPI00117DAE56|nr:hypothetical protein [Nostoc linckia]
MPLFTYGQGTTQIGATRPEDTTKIRGAGVRMDGKVIFGGLKNAANQVLSTDAAGNVILVEGGSGGGVTTEQLTDSLSKFLRATRVPIQDSGFRTKGTINGRVLVLGDTISNAAIANGFTLVISKDSVNPVAAAPTTINILNRVARTTSSSAAAGIRGISINAQVGSANTQAWGTGTIPSHPTTIGFSSTIGAQNGSSGTIPYAAAYFGMGLGAATSAKFRQIDLMNLTGSSNLDVDYLIGWRLSDIDNIADTGNAAIYLSNNDLDRPMKGAWGIFQNNGTPNYLRNGMFIAPNGENYLTGIDSSKARSDFMANNKKWGIFSRRDIHTNNLEADGEVWINKADSGDYRLQVNGGTYISSGLNQTVFRYNSGGVDKTAMTVLSGNATGGHILGLRNGQVDAKYNLINGNAHTSQVAPIVSLKREGNLADSFQITNNLKIKATASDYTTGGYKAIVRNETTGIWEKTTINGVDTTSLSSRINNKVSKTGDTMSGKLVLNDQLVLKDYVTTADAFELPVISKGASTNGEIETRDVADIRTYLNAEDLANKSTNTSLGSSNLLYPSQNAVKTYVDNASTADRNRANHAGTQAQSTIVGLADTLAQRVKPSLDSVKLGLKTLVKANVTTTDATITPIYTMSLPNNGDFVTFFMDVTGKSGNSYSRYIRSFLYRNSSGTVSNNGFVNVGSQVSDAPLNGVTISARVVGTNVEVYVQGLAATNITWRALIDYTYGL